MFSAKEGHLTTKIVYQHQELKSGTRLQKPLLIATRDDGAELYVTVQPDDSGWIELASGGRFPGSFGFIKMADGSRGPDEPTGTSVKMSPYWHFLDDPSKPVN